MNASVLTAAMVFVTPFIIVLAYFISLRSARKRFGTAYVRVTSAYQWKCLKGLALIALYSVLSFSHGGWEKLLSGVSFSASAFTFFTLAIYEMACAISLNHQYPFRKEKAKVFARLFLIGKTVSLVSLVLAFQSLSTYWPYAALQFALLLLAIVAYYLAGTIVGLLEIGHKPVTSSSSST